MKVRKFLAAATVGTLMAVSTAIPANAAWGDCGNFPGTVCLFANANWGLPIWRQTIDQVDDGCVPLYGFNDITTIAANNTTGGVSLRVWRHGNCTDLIGIINSGTHTVFTGANNDEASGVSVILF